MIPLLFESIYILMQREKIGDDKLQDVGSVASELKLQRFLVQTGKYRAGDEDAIKTKQGTIIESPEWCGQDFYAAVQYILQK